jgi:hypothetical protein
MMSYQGDNLYRRWTLAGLLGVALVPRPVGAIESTECATAMTTPPAAVLLTGDQLRASRRSRAAGPALAGFHIELVPDAGLAANPAALAAFRRAAGQWEAVISSPVVVTINAGLSDLGDSRIIGQTFSRRFYSPYPTIRDAIVAAHVDEPVVAAMPTAAQFTASIPTGFTLDGTVSATKANLKALGFTGLDAMSGPSDATVTFNSGFSFDFDNRDGVTAGTIDFETVAAHEIGHVLGFQSSVDVIDTTSPRAIKLAPLDLLRFADGAGSDPSTTADFTTFGRNLVPGVEAVFDDTSDEWRMSTGRLLGDGRQASHWKDDALTGVFIGIMDPTLRSATVQTVSVPDERAIELIGWDVTVASPSTTLAPASTSSTTTSSTTSSSTSSTSSTTTLPPCVTPRCRLDDALHDGACNGATIPALLANRIEHATELVERDTRQSGRKARRTLARARKLFKSAGRMAHTASTRKRASLTPGCAAAIQDTIDDLLSDL